MLNQPGLDTPRAPNLTLESIFRWPHAAKPVRILVPKGLAWLPIAEGPLALQYPTRCGEFSVWGQRGRSQPSHGIAEMVDVDDLTLVIRPVCAAIRAVLAQLAGWRLAACQLRLARR